MPDWFYRTASRPLLFRLPAATAGTVRRLPEQEALCYPDPPHGLGLDRLRPRLAEASRLGMPVLVRLGCTSGTSPSQSAEQCRHLLQDLAPHTHLFALATLAPAV